MAKNNEKTWQEAKKKYHLSNRHIEMAKKLGLNPKKFGSYANHKQQQWKAPLPEYIEYLFDKQSNNKKNEANQ